MAWTNGTHRPPSAEWQATRRAVIRRSGSLCEVIFNGVRCGQPAHEVDHIINKAAGGGDDLANGQMICPSCHRRKTQAEAVAGKARVRAFGRRAVEQHPMDRA